MENPSSPLDTLRQLKEMLDAGAITPTEFEALKQRLVFTTAAPEAAAPAAAVPPVVPVEALVFEPAAEPGFMPEASADFPMAVGGPSYVEAAALPDEPATELAGPPAEGNSSLGLVLAIAGVLVFLAVVAYLGFTRPTTDEHLTSISQTAADSVNTTIETGPQVAPLPATTAVPETVRVAPTNPAPVIQPRPAAPATDSVAPTTKSPATDSASGQ